MTTPVREPIDDAELERRLRSTFDTVIPRLVDPATAHVDLGDLEVEHSTELEVRRRHRQRVGAMAVAGALVAAAVVGIVWVVTRDRPGPAVPAEQPTTTAPGSSLPPWASTLPALVLGAPPLGFTVSTYASGPAGQAFDAPAILVGWSSTGDTTDALVPAVLSSDGIPASNPSARPVERNGVTGTIGSDRDDTTTVAVLEVRGAPLVVRAPSVGIPDDAIVDLASVTTGNGGQLDWVGAGPPPGFVELARQDRDAGMRGVAYRNSTGQALVLAALTDIPVGGLTFAADATVTRRELAGQPGLLVEGSELRAYWTDPTGVVVELMAPGADHIDVDTFLAAAASVRRATPEEEQAFDAAGTSIETIPADATEGEQPTVHLDDRTSATAPSRVSLAD